MSKTYMAIDQYGNTYHDLGPHPRKALLDRLGYSSARRMFIDSKDGRVFHIGYVIGDRWLTLYEVTPKQYEVTPFRRAA